MNTGGRGERGGGGEREGKGGKTLYIHVHTRTYMYSFCTVKSRILFMLLFPASRAHILFI